jgi:serine/threonine-protein kinase
MRLAIFVFVFAMLSWATEARHVANPDEFELFILGSGQSLFFAGLCWMIYIALEPLIRRRWPDSLVAWTRLISGRLTDPLVGRVLLAGALVGIFSTLSVELQAFTRRALEVTPPIPLFDWDQTLRGPRAVLSHLFGTAAVTMFLSLALALLFFVARAIVRKEWLAALAVALIFTAPSYLEGSPIAGAFGLLQAAAFIFVFVRFGLLALMFAIYFAHFLEFPLTTDSSAWYAGTSFFLILVLSAIAVYGFRIALAGKPAFSGARLDD